jgi:putative membrane protein
VKHLSEISACRRDPAPKLLIRLQPVRGVPLKDFVHVKSSIVFGVSILLFPLAAMAATPAVSAQDKIFIQQAAIGGMAEVQEGQLATAQAGSASVKQFGQQMIEQHTPNNQALAALAKEKGLTVPATTDAAHMADTAALKNTAGTAFDTAYIDGQVAGHKQMEQVMQTEIQNGSDSDLKAFAEKTLPVVQDHLKMAQQLQTQAKS